MLNSRIGVPEVVRVGPAPGCPDPVSLPQIQSNRLISLQIAIAGAVQAPPPTPVFHFPGAPL
jgi:hypothetical protein